MSMSKQEQELLKQLDGAYGQKRLNEIVKLRGQLVKDIVKAQLPSQDVLMVLTVLSREIENSFMSKLYPKQEK